MGSLGFGTSLALRRRGPSVWTPALASPAPNAWLDVALSTLANGSGSAPANGDGVASAADVRGGALFAQATSALRPKYDTAVTLNGRPSLAFTTAAGSLFTAASAGFSGDVDWTVYAVAAFDATNGYPGADWPFFVLGSGSGHEIIVGSNQAAAGWSFAGVGAGSQVASSGVPAHELYDVDAYAHVVRLDHRASDGRTRLFIDSRLVASGTSAYSLTTGISLGNGTPFSLQANMHHFALIARSGVDADALAFQHESYLSKRYQLATIFALGDSLDTGYPDGAAGTGSMLAYLRTNLRTLGCSGLTVAVVGKRTDQIQAQATSVTALVSATTGTPAIAIVGGGTNDGFQLGTSPVPSDPTAAAAWSLANTQSTVSALTAAGCKVLVEAMLPAGPSSGKPAGFDTFRTAYNAGLPSLTGIAGVLAVPAVLSDPTNATYYKADQIHLTSTASGGYYQRAIAAVPQVKAALGWG